MSEEKAAYSYAGRDMIPLKEFKKFPSALPYSDPGYSAPTPGEVDQLIKACGWSQSDVAKIVGVSYNPAKGSTTVRKWRAPLTSKEYREIPYAVWRLLLINAGIVVECVKVTDPDEDHALA